RSSARASQRTASDACRPARTVKRSHTAPSRRKLSSVSTCSALLRAPVSSLALSWAMPNCGSANRSRQPSTVGPGTVGPGTSGLGVIGSVIGVGALAGVAIWGGRPWRGSHGAGEGNRTLVSSLGSYSSTIELHPHRPADGNPGNGAVEIAARPHRHEPSPAAGYPPAEPWSQSPRKLSRA